MTALCKCIQGRNTSLKLTDNTGMRTNGDKLDINKFRLEIRKQFNHQSGEILEEHRDGKVGGRKKRTEPTKSLSF